MDMQVAKANAELRGATMTKRRNEIWLKELDTVTNEPVYRSVGKLYVYDMICTM